MSKADQLGTGRFGATARPVSARRAAIGAATGVPTEGVAPPTRLPLDRISPNPDNPRTSLGDLTELTGSLREHGQKQAITVMNRDAYVKANPEREQELAPDATHVVVDGSSRLAAAREAGLTHLNVMVDDDQGADSEAILESALVANVHRQELEPLDEARALQRLLAIHGTQTKLAKRLHKSQGWVSQRLALLNLAPALQERIGEERIDLLRAVGNKPPEEQEAALEALKREQARAEAEKAERRRERQAATVEDPAYAGQPAAAHQATAADPSPAAAAALVTEDTAATGPASDPGDTPGRADGFSSSSQGFPQGPSSGGGEEPRQPAAGGGEGQAPSEADEARSDTETDTEHGTVAGAEGAQPPAVSTESTEPARATGRTEQTQGAEPAAPAVPDPAESQDDGEQRPVSPAHLTPVPAMAPSGPSPALAAPAATASVDAVPEPRGARTGVDGDHAESEHPQEERGIGDHAGPDTAVPPRLPYDDGVFLAHHLIRKMPDTAFDRMLELLNEHQRQRDAARQDSA
ncbi:ParB/RepB/Spo0J family partition protein [Streptomyces sennicomposti]